MTLAIAAAAEVPLAIDLDGTLLRSDVLHESVLKLFGEQPGLALRMPAWLLRGKAGFKQQVAEHVDLEVETLPFNEEVVAWAREQHARGRRLVLCTAADEKFANRVARHFGFFDEVVASDGTTNVSSHRKAAALVERFGRGGFDYAGNSAADVPVWAASRHAIVVGARAGVRKSAHKVAEVEREFPREAGGWRRWVAALRLHQWVKNVLLFLPLLGSHRIFDLGLLPAALSAFVAFGLCASSVYLLNDLVDLESDRRHPRKRRRPFAAGTLSAAAGVAVSVACLAASFAIASTVRIEFVAWLGVYWVLTVLYTLLLKRKVLVDALALAALYTLRILAGGAAVAIDPGFWLLAFSMFIFLSLAFVKRYSELEAMMRQGRHGAHGRDYIIEDLPLVQTLGIVSGFAAVLVLALYINGDSIARLYPHREVVWLTVPILLYWVSRMWVKAHRREMHDDPVIFAMRDRLSLLSIALFVIVMSVAAAPW